MAGRGKKVFSLVEVKKGAEAAAGAAGVAQPFPGIDS